MENGNYGSEFDFYYSLFETKRVFFMDIQWNSLKACFVRN